VRDQERQRSVPCLVAVFHALPLPPRLRVDRTSFKGNLFNGCDVILDLLARRLLEFWSRGCGPKRAYDENPPGGGIPGGLVPVGVAIRGDADSVSDYGRRGRRFASASA